MCMDGSRVEVLPIMEGVILFDAQVWKNLVWLCHAFQEKIVSCQNYAVPVCFSLPVMSLIRCCHLQVNSGHGEKFKVCRLLLYCEENVSLATYFGKNLCMAS